MQRICLISPGHLTSNPRLVKEADALAGAGYQVQVICGHSFPAYADEAHIFAGRSWHVVARVPFGMLAPRWLRWKQRLRQKLALVLCRLGVHHQALILRAWHPAGPELICAARAVAADLYIAHYPPALAAAALAAHQHAAAYAFDAEDFHIGDFPDLRRFNLQRRLLRAIESKWLIGASLVTAASPGIAEAYASIYGLPLPTVVRNVFPLAQAPLRAMHCGSVRPGPTLYWFSQTIGPDRGLECAIAAIALSQARPHLHLRGQIRDDYRQCLHLIARRFGVLDRLHFHEPASPIQLETLASMHDVGLVAETGMTLNRRLALTNKLFSYALAGIPFLLSDIPAHQAVAAEAGKACALFRSEDPHSLAIALDHWLMGPPQRLAEARHAAYYLGQERWNWEREQRVFLSRIATVLQERTNVKASLNL